MGKVVDITGGKRRGGVGPPRLPAKTAAGAEGNRPEQAAETRQRKLTKLDEMREVLRLAKAGATIDQIARTLKWDKRKVGVRLRQVFDAMEGEILRDAEPVLKLELDRLDTALSAVWSRVVNAPRDQGASQPYPWSEQREAIDAMLKIMVRRAKLLGLDAPEQHEVTGRFEFDVAELRAAEESLARRMPPDVTLGEDDVVEIPAAPELDRGPAAS